MPQARPLELAALRVVALLCATFAAISLTILSPDAWRLAVALGVLGAAIAGIGLRRTASPADRLVLIAAMGVAAAAALAAALRQV